MNDTMTESKLTQDTVIGVFNDNQAAERAVNSLKDMGYDPKDISIVMKDAEQAKDIQQSTGATVAEGAASGALTGGMVGAIAGLLVGVGAIAIPGIGAILVGGPLAAALGLTGAAATTASGAVTGALAGGLVGALVSLGLPEEEAKVYEDRVKEGAILVAVPAMHNGPGSEVEQTMSNLGATQIKTLTT